MQREQLTTQIFGCPTPQCSTKRHDESSLAAQLGFPMRHLLRSEGPRLLQIKIAASKCDYCRLALPQKTPLAEAPQGSIKI